MKKKVIALMLLALVLCVITSMPVLAASGKKKAKKAYRKAIKSGEITIPSDAYSAVKDANGDGVPELILFYDTWGDGPMLDIYSYSGSSVELIVSHYAEYSTRYNPSTKTFYMYGEGDGCYREDFQLEGTSLVKICEYRSTAGHGGPTYSKIIDGVTQSATAEECKAAFKKAVTCKNALKKRSEAKLLKLLKK